MANYLKSEWYRIWRGKTVYLFTGVLAAVTLAANLLLFTMAAADPGFPYATVRFSLSNLVGMMSLLFVLTGILTALLYADDVKRGTLKNALMQGMSRTQLFLAKCLMSSLVGVVSMAAILIVYCGSAVLLLEGPALESVEVLFGGMVAVLPTLVASVVFTILCLHLFDGTTGALLLWVTVLIVIPTLLNVFGMYFDPVRALTGWIPWNFFSTEVYVSSSAFDCVWQTPLGFAKCLVTGGGFMILFALFGLARTRRMEL